MRARRGACSARQGRAPKKLDDAGEQLAAAQRKLEQGSQQLQGEVLELPIEESLRRAFRSTPSRRSRRVSAAATFYNMSRPGRVRPRVPSSGKPSGRRNEPAVDFQLKDDMRACGAAVGILVTTPGALPKEWPESAHFALHEDVWVTQPSSALGIAEALRVGLIDLHRQRAVSAGKGEKMEALYDYLTSPQFAQKLKAVYETFKKMREELESEKSVTLQRWARREKQLQGGMTQLLSIGGEIQGLAQQELPMLEMEAQKDLAIRAAPSAAPAQRKEHMSSRESYKPGPAAGADIRKDGEKWTLILVRTREHPPAKSPDALTDPAQLR